MVFSKYGSPFSLSDPLFDDAQISIDDHFASTTCSKYSRHSFLNISWKCLITEWICQWRLL